MFEIIVQTYIVLTPEIKLSLNLNFLRCFASLFSVQVKSKVLALTFKQSVTDVNLISKHEYRSVDLTVAVGRVSGVWFGWGS